LLRALSYVASTTSLGNPCQCFTTLILKKLLPYIQAKSTQFKAFAPCPVTTGLANEILPSFPVGPFRYWKAALRSPHSLLCSRLNRLNSFSLSS